MGEAGPILFIGILMAAVCVLGCLKTLAVEADYQRQLFRLIRESEVLRKSQRTRLRALGTAGAGAVEEAQVVEVGEIVAPDAIEGEDVLEEDSVIAAAA